MLNFQLTAKIKLCKVPLNEHTSQVWLQWVLWFQRRRLKCEKLTDDGCKVMTIAHMAHSWANNRSDG